MEDFEAENAKNTLDSKWSDNENDGVNMYGMPNQMNPNNSADSLYGVSTFRHDDLFKRIH